eukprot:TRINITY_DN13138_c0_g1_i1.p1 TRINITY_DN13138_c0_g1~~TRINITY_DN13138_c0_g1_i1.p1  ORF type:complete len:375 (+),score=72.87 TRINITY_DN13138_c0_g1_i1:71-1195(+)
MNLQKALQHPTIHGYLEQFATHEWHDAVSTIMLVGIKVLRAKSGWLKMDLFTLRQLADEITNQHNTESAMAARHTDWSHAREAFDSYRPNKSSAHNYHEQNYERSDTGHVDRYNPSRIPRANIASRKHYLKPDENWRQSIEYDSPWNQPQHMGTIYDENQENIEIMQRKPWPLEQANPGWWEEMEKMQVKPSKPRPLPDDLTPFQPMTKAVEKQRNIEKANQKRIASRIPEASFSDTFPEVETHFSNERGVKTYHGADVSNESEYDEWTVRDRLRTKGRYAKPPPVGRVIPEAGDYGLEFESTRNDVGHSFRSNEFDMNSKLNESDESLWDGLLNRARASHKRVDFSDQKPRLSVKQDDAAALHLDDYVLHARK